MDNNARGDDIEQRVLEHLVSQGLELSGRNWRRRVGEIDLVMRERTAAGDTIVFVEVRYRRHHALGGGLASIDAGKRARLRRAARAWLQRHADAEQHARIDVIAVGPRQGARVGVGAGTLAPLGTDEHGRSLTLEWVVNAIEDDD